MVANTDVNIGRRMSWEEIAQTYPDMFVALEDYRTSKKSTNGILRGVGKTQEELIPLMKEFASKNNLLSCFYTTEDMGFNALWLQRIR